MLRVQTHTNGIPAQAVVAGLMFHRAGFGADRMVQGELTESQGDALVQAVEALAASKLVLIADGLPPAPDREGAVGIAQFVILHRSAAS